MPDIMMEVPINAAPETLYHALTEQEAIRSWWTQQADYAPKIGSVSEFRFYNGGVVLRLELAEQEANRKVVWKAVSGVPDWPGTSVIWDLVPVENGTKLLFSHRDFPSSDGSLPYTTYNWAWYIISLKKYAETGTGSPHTGDPTT